MSLRILVVFLGACLIASCATNQISSPVSNSETVGYLQGQVTIGPLCPVETVDNPCLPDPSLFTSHKLLIFSADKKLVKEVDIDGSGNYRTDLMPGTYTVDFKPRDIGIPGTFDPPKAEIRQGETTILNIHIDTGIR
ncbi:hypothetical protein L0222_13205 [bacterium]|nr:hypothetical protein [bacterium]MCI0601646.1 hypothetical protein [bacterium]